MGRRIRWLGVVMILCFAVVMVQLVNVQYRKAPALASSPDNPRNVVHSVDNFRGTILAADGTPIAESVHSPVKPEEYERVYPQRTLYSGIVGYDSPNLGLAGLEEEYNSYLSLHKPNQPKSWSQFFSNLLNPPPDTTDNVQLTVEPYLQTTAEQALASIPDANKDGAIVALDPSTGAIEAMYSSPSYDPNFLSSPYANIEQDGDNAFFQTKDHEGFYPGQPMATGYYFQPGSTSKVVTSEAAINLDPANANYSAPTKVCVTFNNSNKPLCNDDNPHGVACGGTYAQMLPPSCDPGFAELGIKVGPQFLAQQGAQFGYNQVPPVDLPGVVASKYPTAAQLGPTQGGQAQTGYASIGQDVVYATALQNALVASGIADHGTVMTPHLMTQIRTAQGAVVEQYKPHPWLQAVSPAAAAAIIPPMQAVATAPGATASGIFPPSLDVAVKTGTAQSGLPGSPTDDWMIGFAPAYDPVVAVAVVVPYQAESASGAEIAGPIMRTMLTAALSHTIPAAG